MFVGNVLCVGLVGTIVDVALSFLYNAGFAYTSWLAYQYDKDNDTYLNTTAALSINYFFYIGNLLGAYKTARYRNYRLRSESVDKLREKVFEKNRINKDW